MDFRFDLIWEARSPLVQGTLITLQVAFLSLAVALVAGLVIAALRMSRFKILTVPAYLYTQFFRGTALYVLLLWIFFALPIVTGISFNPIPSAILALGLLYSAYMAEIYRGALQSIGAGQREAALAVGLSSPQIFFSIMLPQALRLIIPAAANLMVDILKDASIVGIVGVFDLMRTADRLTKFYFRPFEFYTASAIIYIVLVFLFIRLVGVLERRFSRYASSY